MGYSLYLPLLNVAVVSVLVLLAYQHGELFSWQQPNRNGAEGPLIYEYRLPSNILLLSFVLSMISRHADELGWWPIIGFVICAALAGLWYGMRYANGPYAPNQFANANRRLTLEGWLRIVYPGFYYGFALAFYVLSFPRLDSLEQVGEVTWITTLLLTNTLLSRRRVERRRMVLLQRL